MSVKVVNTKRRAFLRTMGGAVGATILGPAVTSAAHAAPKPVTYRLHVATGEAALVGPPHPATQVWSYNNQVPGPQLRVRQGDRLRVEVENALQEETTVHWHGIRLPNAMDGVPHLTQPPIEANGGRFVYEFELPDAGTFWYHPHARSFEQVARGLSGVLIVDEPEPPKVDRDITWVLDDWRLQRDAQVAGNFGNMRDASHAGRLGNTVTVNGVLAESETVRAGERIRLRLANVANARTFGLDFTDHDPQIIAIDGQPVEPHRPQDGMVVVAAAMRVDLIIDLAGKPGAKYSVIDRYYQRRQYRLLDLAYSEQAPLRDSPLDAGMRLPANPLPEPDIKNAERHQVVLAGGAMGRMRSGTVQGKQMSIRDMVRQGLVWTVNGIAERGHTPEPLFTLKRDRSYVIEMLNDTSWEHPMHLHGFSFRVLTRNGVPVPRRPWQDTVLLQPDDRVEIAFVADNPGDWMFHCHILEHQAAGMMSVVRVN